MSFKISQMIISFHVFSGLLCIIFVHSLELENIFKCEVEALRVGTFLSDNYNGPIETEEWDIRMHTDIMTENLGFAPWISDGVWKSKGKSSNGNNAHDLQKKGGWFGHSDPMESPYWSLNNEWVYFMGDSTTRQLWGAFASPFHGNSFERNAKEWTRENVIIVYNLIHSF